jgi:hypothetical protein
MMTWALAAGLFFCLVMIVGIIDDFHIPMPSDWVLLEPIRQWAIKGHESDCSLFNGPAYRPWPCSCRRSGGRVRDMVAVGLQQRAFDEGCAKAKPTVD